MTALSRVVDTRVRQMGVTNQELSDRTHRERCPSGTISPAAIAKYRTGRHPAVPPDRMLRVLSWVLDIPLLDLQRAAGVPLTPEDWIPPAEAHQLSREKRELIERLIRMLAATPPEDTTRCLYEGSRLVAEEDPESVPEPGGDELAKRRAAERRKGPST